jgi:PleD family two-component response regulator
MISLVEDAPGRVLVAADTQVLRGLVARCLKRAGLLVDVAESESGAVRALGDADYDVVVSDLDDCGWAGATLPNVVRRLDCGPEMIVITGAATEDLRRAVAALRLGAFDILTNPPESPDQIVLTVKRAVSSRRLRRAHAFILLELEKLSSTDPATGAGTRRTLDLLIRMEWARPRRSRLPLSLVLLAPRRAEEPGTDLRSDLGLISRELVQRVHPLIREGDGLFHYEGERLALLMPNTDSGGACGVARRVVEAVTREAFCVNGQPVPVVCCAGVAWLDQQRPDPAALAQAAAAALDRALAGGPGQVVVHEDPD